LAAAGLISLGQMPLRLQKDHDNAGLLADGLAAIPGVRVSPVQTNIVIFDISEMGIDSRTLSGLLKERGILANGVGATSMRMVTHYDVTADQCRAALAAVREIAARHLAAAS
jgi:threonine aldolase